MSSYEIVLYDFRSALLESPPPPTQHTHPQQQPTKKHPAGDAFAKIFWIWNFFVFYFTCLIVCPKIQFTKFCNQKQTKNKIQTNPTKNIYANIKHHLYEQTEHPVQWEEWVTRHGMRTAFMFDACWWRWAFCVPHSQMVLIVYDFHTMTNWYSGFGSSFLFCYLSPEFTTAVVLTVGHVRTHFRFMHEVHQFRSSCIILRPANAHFIPLARLFIRLRNKYKYIRIFNS